MPQTYPGTTIEVVTLEKGCSKRLFDGIFATGGITLSQVTLMTGLEPYLIQNWVKRGFVSSPVKRVYTRQQFARIVIINMLRESLQIEKICGLIRLISGESDAPEDDLIGDEELYHRYVDMLSESRLHLADEKSVMQAAEKAAQDFVEPTKGGKKTLIRILSVMLYAHSASRLRDLAGEILMTLQS